MKAKLFFSKWTREGVALAIDYLHQAIALEPDFALAHAALAEAQITGLYFSGKPNERLPIIRHSAERALSLQPNLPEAHYSMGIVNLHQRNWKAAETNFAQALALNPRFAMAHDWKAWLLAALGRMDEALEAIRLAQQLDPLSIIVNPDVAFMLAFSGRRPDAIRQTHETLKMDPTNFQALDLLGHLYRESGDFDQAAKFFQLAEEQLPEETYAISWKAAIAATKGDRDQFLPLIARLKSLYARSEEGRREISRLYLYMGDNDFGFEWAEKAFELNDPNLLWIKVNAEWDHVRNDPRYLALLRRLGLPTEATRR